MVQFTYRNILKENIVNYIASGNKRGKSRYAQGRLILPLLIGKTICYGVKYPPRASIDGTE